MAVREIRTVASRIKEDLGKIRSLEENIRAVDRHLSDDCLREVEDELYSLSMQVAEAILEVSKA